MDTTQFFGYGRYAKREWIKQVIGHEPVGGQSAIVEGYRLAVQVLDELPENVRETIRDIWGDGFRAFTLRKGPGMVSGVIWELSEEDMKKIHEFEFIGKWREIIPTQAKTVEGKTMSVYTEAVYEHQPVKEYADGLNYKETLDLWGRPRETTSELEAEDKEALEQTRAYLAQLQ